MVIHKFNSFRRYTPPTCTLEIYHPQPFWGRWRYQSFPPLFSFQLHFDDPRLAQEDRMSIIGDRDLLEKLRIKVGQYVNQYLNITTIENEKLFCEIPIEKQEREVIYLTRQSAYRHLLYYQSFEPHQEVIEVVLTNTQLVDFVNALEAYHWDATKVRIQPKKRPISLGTGVALTFIIATLGKFLWSGYQVNSSINVAEEISELSAENYSQNIQEVVPPSPLNLKTVPQIVTPKIPEELLNQQPLLPPPPALTQPPTNLLTNSNIKLNNSNQTNTIPPSINQTNSQSSTPSAQSNINNSSLVTGIRTSLPANSESSQPLETSNNLLAPRLPSLPVLSPSDFNQNSIAMASSQINNLSDVGTINQQIQPSLAEKFNSPNSSVIAKRINQNISGEVQQYFRNKWQPPENLNQSIEYRLQLEENGTLTRVTPVGQVAAVFLEQTPVPLIGEVITSSFSKISPLTVRLILSPNGSVRSFVE